MLFTIGYEGRDAAAYLDELRAAGISILCDVRRNARSRKPGFAKSRLAAACAAAGIRYEHVPALGIASERRALVETAADKRALFAEYAGTTLVDETARIGQISGWLRAGERVALMCFERDAHDCHRHLLAGALGGGVDL